MEKIKFFKKYILPFKYLDWIYLKDEGYIVWREGTGNNIELLHVAAFIKRKGIGSKLVKMMINQLKKEHKPYYSVFGFMLAKNDAVIGMYHKLGFKTQIIGDIYKGGNAVMMWQDFDVLCKKMGVG